MSRRTRQVVEIDEDKCTGCGLCVPDCAEGAIQLIDGKARLVADNLCDGLGNCLGSCPTDAITITEREADEFDASAVEDQRRRAAEEAAPAHGAEARGGEGNLPCGCPGTMARKLSPAPRAQVSPGESEPRASRLSHWPVQLALVPVSGDMWQGADVLISADCVAFAMPDFQERLLAGRSLAVACPKLDDVRPYVEKLAEIFAGNDIRSVTVAHMEVPCCTGIVVAVKQALASAGRTDIPLTDVTVGVDGTVRSGS